jgi:hypothetical protein
MVVNSLENDDKPLQQWLVEIWKEVVSKVTACIAER